MTTAMNEAEKLAERLLKDQMHVAFGVKAEYSDRDIEGAAALLRRQAEQIKLLREALDVCAHVLNIEGLPTTAGLARSALAATKEET